MNIHGHFPRIIQAERNSCIDENYQWLLDNGRLLKKNLHRTGAVLLRGFKISDSANFRNICLAITPQLRNYIGGDSPRLAIDDQVYTSTEYDSNLEVLLHNELSYGGWFPSKVIFGCLIPAQSGGATHIANGRQILAALPQDMVEKFTHFGVTYLQYLPDQNLSSGKSWQETFETTSRSQVEHHLIESNIEYEWTNSGLRTQATRPSVQIHPDTKEACWHNQADQWHRKMNSVKDSIYEDSNSENKNKAGVDAFGSHVTYGNGEEIDVSDLLKIRQICAQHEICFQWQQGDVLILDNILTMHGRKPFTGKRSVIVAMS